MCLRYWGLLIFNLVLVTIFIWLSYTVRDNPDPGLDRSVMFWIEAHSRPWVDQLMSVLTYGGDSITLVIVSGILSCFFIIRYQRSREAVAIMVALGIGYALTAVLKYSLHRERPDLWEFIARPDDYSFPSGHAMVSMIVYGSAAYLLESIFPQYRWNFRIAAGILIFLIGASRLYLGVHWPSDVLAGFVAGSLILFNGACWYSRNRTPFRQLRDSAGRLSRHSEPR